MVTTTLQNEGSRAEAQSAELNEVGRAYRLLGGGKILKQPVRNSLDAHDLIMKGLPSRALVHLVSNVTILSSGDALNKAIGMSIRTLQRRKTETDRALSTEQSSRAWRFAEILAQATDVLGDQEAAEAWLLAPAIGLDNRRPIDLLSSAAGAEAVENYLTRMEYGVYT
jgi:putative toxin-antitoxin system antitoxin component (TIGR02293 family)